MEIPPMGERDKTCLTDHSHHSRSLNVHLLSFLLHDEQHGSNPHLVNEFYKTRLFPNDRQEKTFHEGSRRWSPRMVWHQER
jgi:hypothetical protein